MEKVTLSDSLINRICEGKVDEEYMGYLHELDEKLRYLRFLKRIYEKSVNSCELSIIKKYSSFAKSEEKLIDDICPRQTSSAREVSIELEKLRNKVCIEFSLVLRKRIKLAFDIKK